MDASYEPECTEIVFPAAILQAPFFDAAAQGAFNYGAIGDAALAGQAGGLSVQLSQGG